MPPSARVKSAFKAMKDIGIPENKTKPALKRLLKVFDKNWDLIEAENYRVLADAIFEYEESEAAEKEKEKTVNTDRGETSGAPLQQDGLMLDEPMQDEPERPLKRLRLKHQVQAAPSSDQPIPSPGSCFLKIPKPEPGEPEASPQPLERNKGKQPASSQNLGAGSGKPQPSTGLPAKEKRAASERQSKALQIKEPKIKPPTMPAGKQKQPEMKPLIMPKDEPFTDDMVPIEPLAVVLPDCTNNKPPLNPTSQAGSQEDQSSGPSRPEDAIDKGMETLQSSTTKEKQLQDVAISGIAPSGVDIAASTLGGVKISLSCDSGPKGNKIHLPSLETVFKKVNDRCLGTYKIKDPEFSVAKVMKDFCDCVVELGTTDSANPVGSQGQDASCVDKNGSCTVFNDSLNGKGFEDVVFEYRTLTNSSTPLLASNCPPGDKKSNNYGTEEGSAERNGAVDRIQKSIVVIHPFETTDVTKGEEAVLIPLDQSNCEFLPSFHYIPKNVISDNADVKFSLALIGDKDCCISCHGNCLESSACSCAEQNGGCSLYTSDGLVKEDFLDRYISVVRDPQSHCLAYCKECPLERLKNPEDMLDPCKGHLKREFIRECCIRCRCSHYCGNRVIQRGIRCSLQVFWTPDGKGWGLKTLVDLPKGAFVCEYVGEILTCLELHKRNLARSNDKHSYAVLLDTEWGSKALNEEELLCLDATFYGNVARFINHRCSDANLIEIPVEVETPSHHYYHVALFATRTVNANEELTWDYGVDFDDNKQHIKPFHCYCGSQFCRNMKRSSRSRPALTL